LNLTTAEISIGMACFLLGFLSCGLLMALMVRDEQRTDRAKGPISENYKTEKTK
jgi:hypothetical protein